MNLHSGGCLVMGWLEIEGSADLEPGTVSLVADLG